MSSVHFSEADMTNLNKAMESTLAALIKEGIITDEQAIEFSSKYGIVVYNEKWYKRMFNNNSDEYNLKYVNNE